MGVSCHLQSGVVIHTLEPEPVSTLGSTWCEALSSRGQVSEIKASSSKEAKTLGNGAKHSPPGGTFQKSGGPRASGGGHLGNPDFMNQIVSK